ncbi:hypothetical protein CTAYLR_001969 [Chrysophaeum taylorii]|uniref:RRM domain-containing protein n=1 Tax=Chrysophaeum taylorii TaxID=2483200 RepID=A0AAD7UA45_9STRA|nr:hypothetical protein CTAYLR_001969 [Chrysophaeum taylorii]
MADDEENGDAGEIKDTSARVVVTDIPKLCNWSQIRKMFQAHPRISDGRVEAIKGTAWVEFDDAESARTAAKKHESCRFKDDAWAAAQAREARRPSA